jgi:hypothetical protein
MSVAQINRRFAAIYLAAVAAAIAATLYLAPSALAAGSKGGGNISKAGDNASSLIGDIAAPVLITVVGVIAIAAMIQRQMSLAVGAGACALFAGWFLMSHDSVETTFNGVYKAIF